MISVYFAYFWPSELLFCNFFNVYTVSLYIQYIFYSPKTAANTKATKEKTEHVQITAIHGLR